MSALPKHQKTFKNMPRMKMVLITPVTREFFFNPDSKYPNSSNSWYYKYWRFLKNLHGDREFIANCVQNVCAQQLIQSYLQYEIFAHLERKWNNNWNECDVCSLNLGISNSKGFTLYLNDFVLIEIDICCETIDWK